MNKVLSSLFRSVRWRQWQRLQPNGCEPWPGPRVTAKYRIRVQKKCHAGPWGIMPGSRPHPAMHRDVQINVFSMLLESAFRTSQTSFQYIPTLGIYKWLGHAATGMSSPANGAGTALPSMVPSWAGVSNGPWQTEHTASTFRPLSAQTTWPHVHRQDAFRCGLVMGVSSAPGHNDAFGPNPTSAKAERSAPDTLTVTPFPKFESIPTILAIATNSRL